MQRSLLLHTEGPEWDFRKLRRKVFRVQSFVSHVRCDHTCFGAPHAATTFAYSAAVYYEHVCAALAVFYFELY